MTPDGRVNTLDTRKLRLPSALLLLTACALVAACSASFFYNRLNFLVPWYFGTKVTQSEVQEADLKAAVASVTAWHRESELGRYSEFLRTLARQTLEPFSRERIERTARDIESFWAAIVTQLAPGAARWLSSLSAAQVDELLASFAEDDEELRDEQCTPSPEKLQKKRAKGIGRSIKYWTGSVSDQQRSIIERAAAEMRPTGCDWLESRANWRAALAALLAEQRYPGSLEGPLRELMLRPRQTWTAAYVSGFEANRERFFDMLAELDATWSPEQRNRAAGRLEDIAQDLDELQADAN